MLYTQFRFDTGYEPPSSGAVSLDVSDAREPEGFEGGVAAGGSELSRG
jgi:hypothetical protein